jgi:3-oxoacyl-[acyl-carrier-protein] synthase II
MNRVVVTGMGAVTPLGVGSRGLHERWAAGESGIADGEGRCEFDALATLGKKDARRSDRFTQLALVAADEALEEAGWSHGLPYDDRDVACLIGTGIGGLGTIEAQHDVLRRRGAARVSPLAVPMMMANAATAAVALRHGLRGPSHGVVSACAAGAHSIGSAARMVESGEVAAAVTGGAESALTELSRATFGVMEALSPTGISRPFDARRDGFVMGEGAAVLVLERAQAAEARGAPIVGRVVGYGASTDSHHLTAPDPTGEGACAAIRRALDDAAVGPAAVAYVNAHGTSTPLNDRVETLALKQALGREAASIPVSSTKSAIGHLLGAAGAVEAVATLLALRDRIAPPTLGWEEREDGLDLNYVPATAQPLEGRDGELVGLSNSFGFGGHNAVLCLAA